MTKVMNHISGDGTVGNAAVTGSPSNEPVHETDVCLLGRGTSLYWVAQFLSLHATKEDQKAPSFLWLCPTELSKPAALQEQSDELRPVARHGWSWGVRAEFEKAFLEFFPAGQAPSSELPALDVKSAKRLKLGDHEIKAFEKILAHEKLDLRPVHRSLPGAMANAPAEFIQPILWIDEIEVLDGALSTVKVCLPNGEFVKIRAKTFVLGELEESLNQILTDETVLARTAAFTKGKLFQSGYSLRFRHREGEGFALQEPSAQMIPLVANPSKKGANSHLFGIYSGLESVWFGFLTDEELEDNNEILKKIKSSKRVLEKVVAGFEASLEESSETQFLTFEPHMLALDHFKPASLHVENLHFVTDLYGPEAAVFSAGQALKNILPEEILQQVDFKSLKNLLVSHSTKESEHQL